VAALLALASLSLSSIPYLIALGYLAFALLGSSDKRDARLRMTGWAFAALLLVTVLVLVGVAVRIGRLNPNDPSSFVYMSMGVASMVLSMASMLVMALAAFLAALAFGKRDGARYRLLSWSGLCLVFYHVLLLPNAVVGSRGTPKLGSFWAEPLVYGGIALGLLASATVACAFLWASAAADGAAVSTRLPFGYFQREYLLFVGAFSLFLPNMIYLASADWGILRQRADETLSDAVYVGFVLVASLLYLVLLFGVATAAFWVSCRRAGWKPSHWLAARGAGAAGADTAGAEPSLTPQPRVPLARVQLFLLSWRLPLSYAWFIVLVAACSFLGWYGFAAAAPAAAHYLWMLGRDRTRDRRGVIGASATE
jgi:hypothetical protein